MKILLEETFDKFLSFNEKNSQRNLKKFIKAISNNSALLN